MVAIKQLNRDGVQGNQEFLIEVLMLSLLHDSNLVNLIGYCAEGDQRLLVYEYMPMGSLENHLFGKVCDQKLRLCIHFPILKSPTQLFLSHSCILYLLGYNCPCIVFRLLRTCGFFAINLGLNFEH